MKTLARPDMLKAFDELGVLVESRWRAKNYDEDCFPAIASNALVETGLADRVTMAAILSWMHSTPRLTSQHDVKGHFSDLPVTLYVGPRFCIDVYFWVDGTTAIHQHGFSGAFQVLLGSSIHTRYTFQPEHRYNDRFILGRLLFTDSELLKEGDIRKIRSGKEFIHALFHLDRPSATITVRTLHAVTSQPQYSYLKPNLAFDPFFEEPTMAKKVQSVSLLLAIQHADAEAMIGDLLAAADFQTAFSVLQVVHAASSSDLGEVFGASKRKERFQRLLNRSRRTHGEVVDVIPSIFEEQQRTDDLLRLRSSIREKEHRFFLALLVNVPSRAKILEVVNQYFPKQDAVETVLEWVTDLSTTKVWGSSEPNVLGIKNFGDDHLLVLENLLRGRSKRDAHAAFRKEYGKRQRGIGAKLETVTQSFRESPFFRSILSD